MKECKACKSEIDSKATKCPKCGADQRTWFRRHPVLTVILALIILGIIIGLTGKKDQGSNTTGSKPTTQETKATAKIGETVQDGDLAFTATTVTTANSLGNSFTSSKAQGIFYIVTLEIENKGKETKTIDSSMITLTDSQDRKFDRSIEGQTAKGLSQGKVDLFLQQVQPGLSVTGDIVFDIPKDATGLKLVVKSSLFGSGQEVDLGK